MKHPSLLLLAVLLSTATAFAQDIITTKTGEDILAKITEVTKTEVRYAKFESPNGPIFTLLKSNILMIRYENGAKEIFNEESRPKEPAVVPNQTPLQSVQHGGTDPKLLYASKVEKYTRMKHTGTALTILGSVAFIGGIIALSNSTSQYNNNGYYSTSNSAEAGAYALLGGMVGLGVGIPLWIVGAHNQKKYATRLDKVVFHMNISPRGNGLTLAYRF